MSRVKLLLGLLGPAVLLALFVLPRGFKPPADLYYCDGQTSSRLGAWGETIALVVNSGADDVTAYPYFDSLYSSWDRLGLLDPLGLRGRREDAWGRKFRLESFRLPGARETVVRVLSVGRSGVYERGRGDDLYVDVRIDEDARAAVAVRLRTVTPQGTYREIARPVPVPSDDGP
jgi:hypothetical protein